MCTQLKRTYVHNKATTHFTSSSLETPEVKTFISNISITRARMTLTIGIIYFPNHWYNNYTAKTKIISTGLLALF